MNNSNAYDQDYGFSDPREAYFPSSQSQQTSQHGFTLEHRKLIRTLELEKAVPLFGRGRRVLEIGAGAGWQASMLARKGYQVTAIDIPESNYTAIREWNVTHYDGVHIPAPDRYFDTIFSSNVLEHVTDLAGLQREMFRVLKPGGIAVHIMPTPTWRFLTSICFYVKRAIQLYSRYRKSGSIQEEHCTNPTEPRTMLASLRRVLFPPRHGARGSWISELYLFSEARWKRILANNQWQLVSVKDNNLLYSGYRIFGDKLSIETRRCLSSILGSSCKLYVLKRSLVRTIGEWRHDPAHTDEFYGPSGY
jgi:2-polyprenyl-3-methyl-5-hydroxy-6-metoxy-1,4-benzoquinol methylase